MKTKKIIKQIGEIERVKSISRVGNKRTLVVELFGKDTGIIPALDEVMGAMRIPVPDPGLVGAVQAEIDRLEKKPKDKPIAVKCETEEQLMAHSLYERVYCKLPSIISELGRHRYAKDTSLDTVGDILNVLKSVPDGVDDLIEFWEVVEIELRYTTLNSLI